MALEEQNPFGQPPQQWGAWLAPQEGQQEGGSFYGVSPEVMQMMWAPQALPQQQLPQPEVPLGMSLTPQQRVEPLF